MNARERRRLTVFSRVKEGTVSVAQAGRLLGLSVRQARRLGKRYREQGDAGLVHGLRGRPGNAAHGALKEQVLARYRARYRGFSAAHAAGLIANPRQVKQHRQRRERRGAPGELTQMDGSTHAWFGPDLPAARQVMMEEVLCPIEPRSVGQDWCVRHARRILQIVKKHAALALAGKRIDVLEHADGTLKLMYRGKPLVFTEIAARPVTAPAKPLTLAERTPWRPGLNHLWRRAPLGEKHAARTSS